MPMLNKVHAYLGLVLVLPLFVWAVTGFIFLLKPGYSDAYEQLSLAQSAYSAPIKVAPQSNWQQLHFIESVLGGHLLVTTNAGELLQLNPETLRPWPYPTSQQLAQLVSAATMHNRARYGEILEIEQQQHLFHIMTTTEVQLTLDWLKMTLQQSGGDTRFLDRLYRMHYLQWSPVPKLNQALLLLALIGLFATCFVGLRMLILFHQKEQS